MVLARLCYGETLSAVQGLGVGLSLLGVLAVICRGDPAALPERWQVQVSDGRVVARPVAVGDRP